MRLDLHCHSKYSHDNHLDPEDLIRRAIQLGLDGVCFTEHFSFNSSRPVDRMKVPANFLVLRGVEVSTDCGHVLVYGVADDSWNLWGTNNGLKLPEVVESVHELGGICVPAHPFRGWESMGDRIFTFPLFDAVETHNGTNNAEQNRRAAAAAQKLGLPSIGGSDCHYLDRVGAAVTEFENSIANTRDLVREIKTGRCRGVSFATAESSRSKS